MNLHHLQYFQAVAQLKSFTKASESLHISQPTLSYAIGALEKELEVVLINRNGRQATLTEDGEIFLSYVNQAITQLEHGMQYLRNRTEPNSYLVRVIADHLMMVMRDIKRFRQNFDCSNIKFSLDKGIDKHLDIEKMVLNGDYDVGFQSKLPVSAGLEYVQLPDIELVLIVPPDNLLSFVDSIDLREVDWNQDVVARYTNITDPRGYSIASMYKQIDYDQNRASSRAQTTLGVAALVEAGFGIAIVPNLPHLQKFDVKILPITYPAVESAQYMLRKRDTPTLSAADRFFSYTAEHYGQSEVVKL